MPSPSRYSKIHVCNTTKPPILRNELLTEVLFKMGLPRYVYGTVCMIVVGWSVMTYCFIK